MEGNIKKKEKGQSGRNERRLSRKMSEKGIWEKLSQNCTEKNTQRSGKSEERGKQKQDPKKWIGESDKTRKEKGKGKKNRRRKDESEKKKNRR